MKEKRYYFNNELCVGKTILLEGEEFHHLSCVMRTRVGERVCLFNGNGKFYFGNVQRIEKKHAEIKIVEETISKAEPKINLTVYQALAKGDKLALIMQKINELGASNLCLFESDYTDVKSNTTRADRLELISISASKQCGRATITKFDGIKTIDEICNEIKNYDKFFVAYENEERLELSTELINSKNLKNVAIMIGAEGGFSEQEIRKLNMSGAIIVSIGERILRTETASIVCTGLITQILENK